jgi:hypothetical protein
MSMFHYTAYNLIIRSALPLPELLPSQPGAAIDVEVGFAPVDSPRPNAVSVGTHYHVTADEIRFFQEEVGTFLVQKGERIVVDPVPGVEERILRLFILGPALGAILHQRGRLVLYASTVEIEGEAIAFLGEPGAGKSTTAAALLAYGWSMVTDDITPLEFSSGRAMVAPGFPRLELSPDSALALGHKPGHLPQLHPRFDKRALRVKGNFSGSSLPLRCIYLLDEGKVCSIEPVGTQEALVGLLRHSYSVRLLRATGTNAEHLRQCAALIDGIPICRLRRPRSLEGLAEMRIVIEADRYNWRGAPDSLFRMAAAG